MIDLSKYDEYLEPSEDGIKLKGDSPPLVKDELKAINQDYKNIHGVDLVMFQD